MSTLGIRWIGMVAVVALAVGCGEVVDDELPQDGELADLTREATYVGTIDGTDAVMAVTVDGDRAFGYACGGDESLETHTMWFGGDVYDFGDGNLYIDCGTSFMNIAIAPDGTVSGTVKIFDEVGDFFATETVEGTMAGLYKDQDPDCATGAVVFQDSPDAEPFVQGAWCNGAGVFAQVTPMSPVQLTAKGLPVEIPIVEDNPTERYLAPFSL